MRFSGDLALFAMFAIFSSQNFFWVAAFLVALLRDPWLHALQGEALSAVIFIRFQHGVHVMSEVVMYSKKFPDLGCGNEDF